jgi:hypothetical protein
MTLSEYESLVEMRDNWSDLIHHAEASESEEDNTFAEGVRFCIGELDMLLEGVRNETAGAD